MSDKIIGEIIKPHIGENPDPIILKQGEKIHITKEGEHGWVWGVNETGKESWVPRNYLHIVDSLGTAIEDYNAFELTVQLGDIVTILCEESGWFHCINANNLMGWVPNESVVYSP
ncbi:MAG: hypothetical protein K6T85_13110 [Gorillibacterium sp.]|nr:hypothetical protein [Gorillibacterium sp.]